MARVRNFDSGVVRDGDSYQIISQHRIKAGMIDTLRARAAILNSRDRTLLEMYLERGSTFGAMARLGGVHESTMSRRVRRIIARLLRSEFAKCMRQREKMTHFELNVAREHFINGMSGRDIATKYHTSTYHVRKTLAKIRDSLRNENSRQ